MKYVLSPSILSADFAALGSDVTRAVNAGAEYLHIDVMDGMFVPSLSFAMPVIKCIRKVTDAVFDVHLMIVDPDRYVEDFAKSGADIITVHAEACTHLDRVLSHIHAAGCRAGVALNPATPLTALDYVWDKMDMALLMTVNPGFGGQKYIPAMTQKIAQLRRTADQMKPELDIEVDGGINVSTIRTVVEAGANVIVAGSAVFGPGDLEGRARELLALMNVGSQSPCQND